MKFNYLHVTFHYYDGIIKLARQLPELCPIPINFMKLNSILQDIKQVSHVNIWVPRYLVQKHQP